MYLDSGIDYEIKLFQKKLGIDRCILFYDIYASDSVKVHA